MSRLRIYNDSDPNLPQLDSRDGEQIAAELSKIGVTFERWKANQPIEPGASPEQVMAAYREDIERLSAERGLKTVDVVSIAPDNPKREEMRAKFLDEHFHKEDEVRFFVAGTHDAVTTPADGRFLQERIPGAEYVEFPAAHLSNVQMGAAFTQRVLAFLSA